MTPVLVDSTSHRRLWIFERVLPLVQSPPARQPELRRNLVSVYFPGFSATRAQAARYTGPEGVTVLDPADPGRVLYEATVDFAPRILHNVLPQPEVHDVGYVRGPWDLVRNPLAVFTMIPDRVRNAALRTRNVPNAFMRLTRVDIGGTEDQADCRAAIIRGAAAAARDGKRLVLMGCSRGAATMLSTVLSLEDPAVAEAIALVIVEAPFDTVDAVVRKTSFFPRTTLALLKLVGTYKGAEAHATPMRTIERCCTNGPIPLTAPIAFITSTVDTRVPQDLTLRVMRRLRKCQPQLAIHHLELKASNHSAMAVGNDADRAAYIEFVEGLYEQYCPAV